MRTQGRKKLIFAVNGSDVSVYLESASLGRHFPSHSRGWMQFVNHTRPGHEPGSVHQGTFLGMAVKMTPNWTETCWRAGWREKQQRGAGPDLNYNRFVRAAAAKKAVRYVL